MPRTHQFLWGLNIKHVASSIEHPQTNELAKIVNKVIINELINTFRSGQGKVDQRTARGLMGIQMHTLVDKAQDSIQPHLWH